MFVHSFIPLFIFSQSVFRVAVDPHWVQGERIQNSRIEYRYHRKCNLRQGAEDSGKSELTPLKQRSYQDLVNINDIEQQIKAFGATEKFSPYHPKIVSFNPDDAAAVRPQTKLAMLSGWERRYTLSPVNHCAASQ